MKHPTWTILLMRECYLLIFILSSQGNPCAGLLFALLKSYCSSGLLFLVFSIDFLIRQFSISRDKFSIIGNLPYNISSQILFKILEYRNKIGLVVIMLQKEVASNCIYIIGPIFTGSHIQYIRIISRLSYCWNCNI